MSAIVDDHDGNYEPVKVLIALHDGMDIGDAMGPLDVFSSALHNKDDKNSKAFRVIFAGTQEQTVTAQGASIRAHIDYKEAMQRLPEIDVLVIPGGGTDPTLSDKDQPLMLVKAYAAQQSKNPDRERTLMSVSTASLALANAGLLSGLAATTHPDFVTKLEIVCSKAAQRDLADRTDVMEARYVVNNLRFELGDDEEDNPYVLSRKELKEHKRRKSSAGKVPSPIEEQPNGSGRRPSGARKGSMSLKMSNSRRESVMKRANLRLGGLRVLTTGGTASGVDGALYLVGALVSEESADEIVREKGYNWQKGIVVRGIDV